MAHVLFICNHNAGRSPMCEALLDREAAGRHEARSAGTDPADRVHEHVIEAMKEIGIDLSGRRPQKVTRELQEWADLVVLMGGADPDSRSPDARYLEWNVADPENMDLQETRALRDQLEGRVRNLASEVDAGFE